MTEELQQQIIELTSVHKGLINVTGSNAETIVSGALPFEASAEGLETITESFEIELTIPNDFPEALPTAKETGGRITDYDHRNAGGTLCLAVPIEERRIFLSQPTLLGFVDRLVIPFLYGYCFWKKHGRHPFGEYAHGSEGILRHYIDTLGLRDELTALSVICFLFEHGYRGHHDCPCGSGLRVRACHGLALLALYQTHSQKSLQYDFQAILGVCYARSLSLPKPLQRQVVRLLKKIHQNDN